MKKLKFLFLALIATLSFVGCQNESSSLSEESNNQKLTTDSELVSSILEITRDSELKSEAATSNGGDLKIVFPISMEIYFKNDPTKSTTISFKESRQLYMFLKALDKIKFISIKYPISVTNEKGEVIVVNSNKEFLDLIKSSNNDIKDCYKVKYPLSVDTNDGKMITVNNNAELKKLFGVIETIKFPFDVTTEKGVVISIKNRDDLKMLVGKLCKGDVVENEDCIKVKYPLSVDTNDGKMITVNNNAELKKLFGVIETIKFPFDVTNDKGVVTSIKNRDELKMLVGKLCKDDVILDNGCVKVKYPLSVDTNDGKVITVSNNAELKKLFGVIETIKFPFDVTSDKGVVTSIKNRDDLKMLIGKLCKDDIIIDNGCIALKYPFTVSTTDDKIITIADYKELKKAYGLYKTLKYPFDVIDTKGVVISIKNAEDLKMLIGKHCK